MRPKGFGNLSAEDLLVVRETYDILDERRTQELPPIRNGKELAEELNRRFEHGRATIDGSLSAKRVGKVVTKVEESLRTRLFDRKRGAGSGWTISPQLTQRRARDVMSKIDDVLRVMGYLLQPNSASVIEVGCSKSLADLMIPEVCEEFTEEVTRGLHKEVSCEADAFAIRIKEGEPHVLRNLGITFGMYDIVVCSCDPQARTRDDRECDGEGRFPLKLLVNRKNALAQKASLGWPDFRGYSVLLQSIGRNPQPSYPLALLRKAGVSSERVASYAEAIAAVRAAGSAGKVVCVGCPDVHPLELRLGVCARGMEGLTTITVMSMRPKKAARYATDGKQQVVRALSQKIGKRLEELSQRAQEPMFDGVFLPGRCSVFYVTPRQTETEDFHWMRSNLYNVSIGSGGQFQADYVVFNRFKGNRGIGYRVMGQVNKLSNSRKYQVLLQGVTNRGEDKDEFTAQFMVDEHSLSEPWVGWWIGRGSWNPEQKETVGQIVLWPNYSKVNDPNIDRDTEDELEDRIAAYFKDSGLDHRLMMPLPRSNRAPSKTARKPPARRRSGK